MKYLVLLFIFNTFIFANNKPNIILIMTDDMGFSDLSCYGAEIKTPALDELARNGLRFTQFYNAGRCCPTRASLLTGLYPHQAGIGAMTNDEGPKNPGYRGRLMERCVTIAEVLSNNGYLTIQTGKWHLGEKKKEWWPTGRGFDRCFTSPAGGGFYFRPSAFHAKRFIVRGDQVVYSPTVDPPKNFYTTDAYTDEGLQYVREAVKKDKPFFWYLAYNAPHWPLKAKVKDIAKYRGKYKSGWDVIRQKRYENLIKEGLISKDILLSARDSEIPAWNKLSDKEKDFQDHIMATYAGMINCVDQNIAKIVNELKRLKQFDNTLILFLCDNGGAPSGGKIGLNKGKGEIGSVESFAYYGTAWSNVSNTPFRKHKMFVHEGGISTPFIVHWPNGVNKVLNGTLIKEPSHIIDIMATCVDISGSTYPKKFKGHNIIPMEGLSLAKAFQGQTLNRLNPIFFEHIGNKAIRKGGWKLVAQRNQKWELYNMVKDRTELNDLALKYPEKVKELSKQYENWARRCFVNKKK